MNHTAGNMDAATSCPTVVSTCGTSRRRACRSVAGDGGAPKDPPLEPYLPPPLPPPRSRASPPLPPRPPRVAPDLYDLPRPPPAPYSPSASFSDSYSPHWLVEPPRGPPPFAASHSRAPSFVNGNSS